MILPRRNMKSVHLTADGRKKRKFVTMALNLEGIKKSSDVKGENRFPYLDKNIPLSWYFGDYVCPFCCLLTIHSSIK